MDDKTNQKALFTACVIIFIAILGVFLFMSFDRETQFNQSSLTSSAGKLIDQAQ